MNKEGECALTAVKMILIQLVLYVALSLSILSHTHSHAEHAPLFRSLNNLFLHIPYFPRVPPSL